MKFHKIVSLLENENNLPIKPERLAKIIRESGIIDQILFVGVDLNTTILRGKFVRVTLKDATPSPMTPPYAIPEGGLIAKVYYARNQPEDYIRLVINKELLHLLDPDFIRTATREQIVTLANHLRLPTELMVSTQNGNNAEVLIDYLSDYRAVIAMVPQPLRNMICEKYSAGRISEEQIATLTGIPLKYVSMLLAEEQWAALRNLWIGI